MSARGGNTVARKIGEAVEKCGSAGEFEASKGGEFFELVGKRVVIEDKHHASFAFTVDYGDYMSAAFDNRFAVLERLAVERGGAAVKADTDAVGISAQIAYLLGCHVDWQRQRLMHDIQWV